MRIIQSSVKPSMKHSRLLHPGSRIISVEKVQRVLAVLASITNASDEYGPSSIVKEYLLGEKEKTKKGESEGQEAGTENRTD